MGTPATRHRVQDARQRRDRRHGRRATVHHHRCNGVAVQPDSIVAKCESNKFIVNGTGRARSRARPASSRTDADSLRSATANDFTGTVQINAGILKANNVTALGTAAAGTTIAAGATLEIGIGGSFACQPRRGRDHRVRQGRPRPRGDHQLRHRLAIRAPQGDARTATRPSAAPPGGISVNKPPTPAPSAFSPATATTLPRWA